MDNKSNTCDQNALPDTGQHGPHTGLETASLCVNSRTLAASLNIRRLLSFHHFNNTPGFTKCADLTGEDGSIYVGK